MKDKYLEVLKSINEWVIVSDWAQKFSESYPKEYIKAQKEAAAQKQDTTGLREIAARMSSGVSGGAFQGHIEVDLSERPKKVRWISEEDAKSVEQREIEEDVGPIDRRLIEKEHFEALSTKDKFRLNEFEESIKQLNKYFGTDFELEHANALKNKEEPGKHHPDNIQILTKSHNRIKSNKSWERFRFSEQELYIKTIVENQKIISKKMGIDIEEDVLELILEKVEKIF